MPRPREFNTQTVIDQALCVFRKQGYKGSSLQDLIRAMGISKSSFYETFGSKYALFLTALSRFDETEAIYQFVDPNLDIPAKTMITDVFTQLIDSVVEGKGGCLYGNCAIEFSNADQEVISKISNGINQLDAMFQKILIMGQKNGEFSKENNIQNTAQQLTTTFYGLQIMANANFDGAALNKIILNAVAELD